MQQRNVLFWLLFPVGVVLSLVVLGAGIWLAMTQRGMAVLAAGCVCVVSTVFLGLLAALIHGAQKDALGQAEALMAPINERLQHLSVLLNQVSEQQLISERAKAIAFRESEREALRRAIREEMTRRDWDAALTLANEIERVFGYKQEADTFRKEIEAYRDGEVRRIVSEGMAMMEMHCSAEQWTLAMREAERLMGLFPTDAQSQSLADEVEARRQKFKRQLLESWTDAVTRHDIDSSIEILKRLDLYLTPQEAAAMQEPARQVFKDKLLMLGQQFTLAMKERRWQEAVRTGEAIVSEFPNSRMAVEVKDKMNLLRQRAAEGSPPNLVKV